MNPSHRLERSKEDKILKEFHLYLRNEGRLAERTIKGYIETIKNYFRYGYKITVEDAKKYYLWKLETTESTYFHKNVSYALKHFFRMNGIELNIKAPKLVHKRRKNLTYKEAVLFLNVIKDIRDRCMVLLQLQTGLRPGEVLNIDLKDLDLKKSKKK